jgi:predicted RNase H-like nuclease
MPAILGIDTAWTEGGSSGIALLKEDMGGWNCVAAERSYAAFMYKGRVASLGLEDSQPITLPNPLALLLAAKNLLGGDKVDVVAVDIPIANVPVVGRRVADNAISCKFGARWCGTHSASRNRPGEVGTRISEGFGQLGYELATAGKPAGDASRLIEVYPHVAVLKLLEFLGVTRRIPYKVGKSKTYWPNSSLQERKELLLIELAEILRVLRQEICGITLELPTPVKVESLSSLKPFEDAIDAIVCAWVGVNYLRKKATAYGDHTAAIWVPT